MTTRLARVALYCSVGLLVTVLWSNWAETEKPVEREPYNRKFGSIVGLAIGEAHPPFIKRRLVPDVSRAIVAVVPDAVWRSVIDAVDAVPALSRRLQDSWWWKDRAFWPLLFAATFVLWISAVAYAFAAEALIACYLALSPRLRVTLAAVLTFALLGGNGGGYQWYPYDFPAAALFAWGLVGIERRRWWLPIVFAAAAYGKETAAFLILLMVAHGAVRRERWFWMQAAACAAIFAVIQVHLSLRFDAPPLVDNFNSLERNLGYLAWYVTFSSWGVVVLFLLATRLAVLWPTIPIGLRLAVLLLPLYLAAALFKGWIEEYRQYGELLLPFGLVAILRMQTDLGNLRRQGRSAPPGRNEPSNRKQS